MRIVNYHGAIITTVWGDTLRKADLSKARLPCNLEGANLEGIQRLRTDLNTH